MIIGPIIKGWELYFDVTNGYENRTVVAKAFADFWVERVYGGKLEIPGKTMLGGKVFGRKGFDDGTEIFTSYIKSIERIELGDHNGCPA